MATSLVPLPQSPKPSYPPHYIVSVSHERWPSQGAIERSYGRFSIEAIPEDGSRRYTVQKIETGKDAMDMGDDRTFPVYQPPEEIAKDLSLEYINSGVFCIDFDPRKNNERKEEFETLLEQAEARRTAWYQNLILDADNLWSRTHNYQLIADICRRAAKRMKLTREWATLAPLQDECPACGERVKAGVALCKGCGNILDPKKYAEMQFAGNPAKA